MKKQLAGAALVALAAVPMAANAVVYQFNANLSAANELHTVASPATGVATLFYDTADNTYDFSMSVFNLTGAATAFHIHGAATAAETATVRVGLDAAPFVNFNSGGILLVGLGCGIIAGADEAQVRALFTYGDALGIAFQIVDDLLDYGGTDAAIGKNTGDDFRERKLTLPVIKAVALADAEERAFWLRVIEKGDQREGDLDHAMALMARHGAMEAARTEALAWAAQARAALTVLPEHPLRQMLEDLADYVVARIS